MSNIFFHSCSIYFLFSRIYLRSLFLILSSAQKVVHTFGDHRKWVCRKRGCRSSYWECLHHGGHCLKLHFFMWKHCVRGIFLQVMTQNISSWSDRWFFDEKFPLEVLVSRRDTRGHPFNTCALFYRKLTFLTPWNAHLGVLLGVRNVGFSETFAYVLNGWYFKNSRMC